MKNLGGRPSKMTQHFMEVAEQVITDNILACTDLDILFLINEKLEPSERIADSTWEFWKAGKYGDDDRRDWFLGIIKKALIVERNNILNNLKNDDKAWQRWAWIMERKFDDWNIKNKTDITTNGKSLPVPILNAISSNDSNKETAEPDKED